MIIIELTYQKEMTEIEACLAEHRAFLQEHYDQGHLLASGPQNPRTGGIIIALTDLASAKKIMQDDPFAIHELATYRFIEFEPVKHHDAISKLI